MARHCGLLPAAPRGHRLSRRDADAAGALDGATIGGERAGGVNTVSQYWTTITPQNRHTQLASCCICDSFQRWSIDPIEPQIGTRHAPAYNRKGVPPSGEGRIFDRMRRLFLARSDRMVNGSASRNEWSQWDEWRTITPLDSPLPAPPPTDPFGSRVNHSTIVARGL
jgi:hypothetical protein